MTGEVALSGPLAPPMANGEVVFEAPWQGRVFAMAVGLTEQGAFSWAEFQDELIRVIGDWDAWSHGREAGEIGDYEYYTLFSDALANLLDARGLAPANDLNRRVAELEARPHDHDHHHGHDHTHPHDH